MSMLRPCKHVRFLSLGGATQRLPWGFCSASHCNDFQHHPASLCSEWLTSQGPVETFGAAGGQTGSLVCLSDCSNKWITDRRNFRYFCITLFLLPKLFSIFFRQEERTSNQWNGKVTKSSVSRWQRCSQPTWAGWGTEVYWTCLDLARLAESWILSFILYWTSLGYCAPYFGVLEIKLVVPSPPPISFIPVLCLVTLLCPALCDPMDCSLPGSSVYGDSSGKNTGVGCYALLQGIFPTQRSNPGLLHCRRILYSLSHQRSPSFIPTLYLPFMIWRLAISVTYEMRDVYNWKVYPCLIIWRLTICAWVVFPDTEIDWQWAIHTMLLQAPCL